MEKKKCSHRRVCYDITFCVVVEWGGVKPSATTFPAVWSKKKKVGAVFLEGEGMQEGSNQSGEQLPPPLKGAMIT